MIDKPWAWVRILASDIFFICPVEFFLSLLPWRSVGSSYFDWGLQKFNNVDSNNDRQILNIIVLNIEYNVDIHTKYYVYIYIYIYSSCNRNHVRKCITNLIFFM